MKVIDLLNKIANGITYTRKARIRYFDRKNDYEDECNLSEVAIGFRLYNQNIELNDKVEILEEEKKIPEKINWKPKESMAGQLTQKEQIEVIARRTEKLKKEFNNLLDYLKSKGE